MSLRHGSYHVVVFVKAPFGITVHLKADLFPDNFAVAG